MPSTSKSQQRFFGMLHAAKKGDIPASDLDAKAKKALNGMSDKQIRDFAATKTKGLPEKKRKRSAKGKRDAQPSDKTASIRRMILEKLARETSKVPTDPVMEYKGANPGTALKDDTATGCEIKSSNPAALNLKQYHLKPRTISDKDMAKLQKSASIKHIISGMRKQASVNKIAGILKLANTAGLIGNIVNKTTRPAAGKPVRQTRKAMPRYTPAISNKTAAIKDRAMRKLASAVIATGLFGTQYTDPNASVFSNLGEVIEEFQNRDNPEYWAERTKQDAKNARAMKERKRKYLEHGEKMRWYLDADKIRADKAERNLRNVLGVTTGLGAGYGLTSLLTRNPWLRGAGAGIGGIGGYLAANPKLVTDFMNRFKNNNKMASVRRKAMPGNPPTSISNKTAAIRGERLISPVLGMSTGAGIGGSLAYLVARKITENRLARAGITGLGALMGAETGARLGVAANPWIFGELKSASEEHKDVNKLANFSPNKVQKYGNIHALHLGPGLNHAFDVADADYINAAQMGLTGTAAGGSLAYLIARKITENRLARAGITGAGALIGGVGGTYLGFGTGPALRKELRKLHNSL